MDSEARAATSPSLPGRGTAETRTAEEADTLVGTAPNRRSAFSCASVSWPSGPRRGCIDENSTRTERRNAAYSRWGGTLRYTLCYETASDRERP